MSRINIDTMKTFEFDEGAVRCRVCKAVMKPAEITLKDRVALLLYGSSTMLLHYQCPDCKKELITIEK